MDIRLLEPVGLDEKDMIFPVMEETEDSLYYIGIDGEKRLRKSDEGTAYVVVPKTYILSVISDGYHSNKKELPPKGYHFYHIPEGITPEEFEENFNQWLETNGKYCQCGLPMRLHAMTFIRELERPFWISDVEKVTISKLPDQE